MAKTDNKNNVSEALDELGERELGSIKVLIVEDDTMIRELVVTKLVKSGCIPYSTANGSEAVALAEQYKPHAIILDLMLPGMTGEEILTILKSKDTLKDIFVIVFSNKSEETDKKKLLEMGADFYFVKAMTDLNQLVEELKGLGKRK